MLDELNKQQREALLGSFTNDTLVLAGAGSGKTRLIVERINHLINDRKVEPYRIMCITFTNKAATELRERISNVCGEELADQIWIGTFHNICIRLLRMYGANIGLNKFTILIPYDAKKVLINELKKMKAEASTEIVNNYLDRISHLKNKLITPRDYRNSCKINGTEDAVFMELYANFQRENLKNQTIDFDDIILYTVFLLTHNKEAKDFVVDTFKYISVDEVQDSNHANTVLFELLSETSNLFIVGDDSQSIYGWRGAVPEYLVNNQDKYKLFKLEQNYRSTKKIVHASNMVIANNNNRIDKVCFSENEDGDNITVSRFNDPYEEANFIANEAYAYNKLGVSFNEMFILYRTNAQSRIFEEIFMKKGVPYTLIGALSFNERKEIKDCMAFAKIKDNDKDKPSFLRVLKTLDGIGEKAIKDITDIYDATRSIIATLQKYKPKGKKANNSITFLFNFLSDVNSYNALHNIINHFISKYTTENIEDSKARIENLNELTSLIEEKEKANVSFEDFVNEMDLMSSKDVENKTDSVSMMTIHSSKGLEAKIVFICGANQNILPHANATDDKEKEEERRLMYVAMTRAQKKLYITSYNMHGNRSYMQSQFINEIPNTCKEII